MNPQKNVSLGETIRKVMENFSEEERKKFDVMIPINERYLYCEESKPLSKKYLAYLIEIETKTPQKSQKISNLSDLRKKDYFNSERNFLEEDLQWDILIENLMIKHDDIEFDLRLIPLKEKEQKKEPIPAGYWQESCGGLNVSSCGIPDFFRGFF
ncbi:MAG TPA: hypothetical protein PKC14_01485 [Candidatus Absconditabacterales bacterium]|nr:hypothetical protein [Candidatus Absconditabacterales bacterium]